LEVSSIRSANSISSGTWDAWRAPIALWAMIMCAMLAGIQQSSIPLPSFAGLYGVCLVPVKWLPDYLQGPTYPSAT